MSTFVGTQFIFLRYGRSLQALEIALGDDTTGLSALRTGEIGTWHGVGLIHSSAPPPGVNGHIKPNQITHGPQKKGRGGKVRRW